MRTGFKTFALISALVAGLAAAPALYAHDSDRSDRHMMGPGGMMGMMRMDGMMNMMRGMMGMMGMDGMMDMMRGMMGGQHGPKPNEQWREKPPATPKREG